MNKICHSWNLRIDNVSEVMMRKEAGDMPGEVAGDRSSGVLWATGEYLDLFLVQGVFMQKSEII